MPSHKKVPVIRDGIVYWRCGKCKALKEAADFYKTKLTANDLQSSCKLCSAKMIKKWQRENKVYFAEYRVSKKGKRNNRKANAKWSGNNPEKVKAHGIANYAKKTGSLVPEPCEVCGTTVDIHAHHDDYSRPLEVRWLCRTHHNEHHQNLKIGERNAQYILMDISPY